MAYAPPTCEITQLRDVTSVATPPSVALSLSGLIIGTSGPKSITLPGGQHATLSTLHLIDESDDVGLEVRLWNRDAVRYGGFRPMDVVRVSRVHATKGKSGSGEIYLGLRGYSKVERIVEEEEGKGVLKWRDKRFGELVRMVGEGRVVVGREEMVARGALRGGKRRRAEGKWVEWSGVRVIGVRLRGEGDIGEALRRGIKRVCGECGEGKCGGCVGGGNWDWRFGRVYVVIEKDGGEKVVCVAKEEAVERLLFGVTAREVEEGGAETVRRCGRILEALAEEKGKLRVVVGRNEEEVGGWELVHVFVDV